MGAEGTLRPILTGSVEDHARNLETICQWSPFATQEALLDQVGCQNAWKDNVFSSYHFWTPRRLELCPPSSTWQVSLRGTTGRFFVRTVVPGLHACSRALGGNRSGRLTGFKLRLVGYAHGKPQSVSLLAHRLQSTIWCWAQGLQTAVRVFLHPFCHQSLRLPAVQEQGRIIDLILE